MFSYSDLIAVYLKKFLTEVEPDRRFSSAGKLSGAEAVGQTGFTDTRVSDHDDLTGATTAREVTLR